MKHVMLDLETMGQNALAPFVQIGAVAFDIETGELGEEFFVEVSLEDALARGARIDAATVLWWLGQDQEARDAIRNPANPLTEKEALTRLSQWLYDISSGLPEKEVTVWGNGASFDITILESGYRRNRLKIPWAFWHVECYRTVKNRFGRFAKRPYRAKVAHHALADARYQAEHLCAIMAALKATA